MNTLQRYIITALVTAIVIFLLWYFSNIVGYILISAVISFIGNPLVDILCKINFGSRKMPMWLAAAITLVFLWGVLIGILWIFTPIVIDKINILSTTNLSDIAAIVDRTITQIEEYIANTFNDSFIAGHRSLMDIIQEQFTAALSYYVSGVEIIISKATTMAIYAFSVTFITFFFLKERALFQNAVLILFPAKREESVKRALSSSINLLSRYFIGLMLESLIKMVVVSLCFYFIIGMPLADSLMIAMITAILNVIPYIGPLMGGVIAVILAITSSDIAVAMPTLVWQILLILTIFQLIDNIVLQPYIYSESVKAHPLEIFIVILMAGSIAGIMGMLLAIPAYTVLRVFAKEFFSKLRVVQKLTEKI